MLASSSWRIARIGGVDIRIDPSWGVIALLVGYTFFVMVAAAFPLAGATLASGIATTMTFVFFGSLVLHELAHAWLAKSRGIEVRGITLFLFGGATEAELDGKKPSDEFWIAAVGPLTSLAIAATLWAVVEFAGPLIGEPARFAAGRLGWINLVLAVFNLLPGFPLDGGRLVRSAVWGATGSLDRSTRIAARIGQGMGLLLIGLGTFEILIGSPVSGVWTAAIGWFLNRAAEAELARVRIRGTLSGVTVAEVMERVPAPVSSTTTLDQVVHDHLLRAGVPTVAVRDNGHIAGVVTIDAIRGIPKAAWAERTAGDVMTDVAGHPSVPARQPVAEVLDQLRRNGRTALVLDSGDLVGTVSLVTLAEWLDRRSALGLIPNGERLAS